MERSEFSIHNMRRHGFVVVTLLIGLCLMGCRLEDGADDSDAVSDGMGSHVMTSNGHRAETDMPSPIPLDPSRGQEIGTVFEAFLSPHQEGGEEADTPDFIPDVFKSTRPSVPRNERTSRGHGVLSFTKDLSKAYVHIAIENVDPDDIVMFHVHCGRPGQLGPIIINFALAGDINRYWEDGVLSLALTNEDIEAVVDHATGVVGNLTDGCPIIMALPMDKVKTIAGMETIAREGQLYFNLHTAGQTFFGDIRGQLYMVENP